MTCKRRFVTSFFLLLDCRSFNFFERKENLCLIKQYGTTIVDVVVKYLQKMEVINHVISLAKSELCIILSLNWLPLDIKEASKCSFKKKLVTYDETLGCLMERVHDMIEKESS